MQSWEQVFLEYLGYGEAGIDSVTYLLNFPLVKGVQPDSDEDRRMIESFCTVVLSDQVSNDLVMLILTDLYVRIWVYGFERLAFVFAKLLYPCWLDFQAMFLGMLEILRNEASPTVWQIITRELDACRNNPTVSAEFLQFLTEYGF